MYMSAPLATRLRGYLSVATKTNEWSGSVGGFESSIKKVQLEMMAPWLCGYIKLPDGHPWLELGYEVDCDIHGGITYNQDGEVGFDCGHHGDHIQVQNIDYVKSELESLASQAKEAMSE